MTSLAPRIARPIVRVRYAETDQMGVAYYANYLVWFEVGRTEWLRETGWTYRTMEDEGLALPVIEVRCEYKHSARYDDELEIRTVGRLVSAVRLRFDYEVVRRADEVTVAVGHTVHATIDDRGRPIRVPAQVKALLGNAVQPGAGSDDARKMEGALSRVPGFVSNVGESSGQ